MKHTLRALAATALLATSIVTAPAQAADDAATVNVALLDMSSLMGGGMMGMMAPGQGMMGQDWNWNMMGSGQGMMGRGMMAPGWGMMGQGMMGMGMMSIRVDQPTVKAGKIHFEVTNWSRAVLHEVLVVAVENPNAPLPYDYTTGRIPEDQIKSMGEVGELKANESGAMDVELPPGTYLLICNLAGHYAAGMVTPLTVTP